MSHLHLQFSNISYLLGIFFQAQDDFLDCYGSSSITGKIGTDISSGKCSWLIATALLSANQLQTSILINNYAINEPDAITRVIDVYNQLNIKQQFKDYENNSLLHLKQIISTLPNSFQPFLELILNKLFNRQA